MINASSQTRARPDDSRARVKMAPDAVISRNRVRILDFIRNHRSFDYVLILLMSGHVLLWFSGNGAFMWGDFVLPLDPLSAMHNMMGTLSPINLGAFLPANIVVPEYGAFAFFQSLGFPLYIIERIYFFGIWSLAGISAYYFSGSFGEPNPDAFGRRVLCLVAAVFYEFNLSGYLTLPAFLSYATMPLVLGLYFHGIRAQKKAPLYLIGIGLASYGLLLDYPVVRLLILSFLVMAAYTIYLLVTTKGKRIQLITFFFASIATTVLVWAWFIFPVVAIISNPSTVAAIISNTPQTFGDLGSATILEVSRLTDSGGFTYISYPPFTSFYYSIPGVLLSYSIPSLAFGAVILQPRNKRILFSAIMALGFLVLAAGPNPPFGWIYQWLVLRYWFLRPFITSYYSIVGATVFYSVLIGSSAAYLYERLRPRRSRKSSVVLRNMNKFAVIAILALIIASAFPMASPERLGYFGTVRLPPSYHEANNWLSSQEGFTRVLIAPAVPPYANFNWTSKIIGNPYALLLSVPFVASAFAQTYAATASSNVISDVYYNLDQWPQNSTTAGQICGGLKVMSIRDVFYDGYYSGSSPTKFSTSALQIGLQSVANFSAISIFQTQQSNPEIFVSTTAQGFSDVPSLLTAACISRTNFLGFVYDQLNKPLSAYATSETSNPPSVAISASSDGFNVKVHNATSSFFVVLSQAFSPYWEASLNGGSLVHIVANGFSNAWYLNQKGNYVIQIHYLPTFFSYTGFGIGLAAIVTLLLIYTKGSTSFWKDRRTSTKQSHLRKDSVGT
ncbi:MAG: hypothetical protein JRN15_09960 [Nitrososphaerota archaeon]|nr:hypothetical protein [Nitrososphaerota archaeon]